ncbi:MAG: ATP synthase F1 subunit epsilon [Pseudomonadota bacterium]
MSQFAFSLISPERELFSGDVDSVVMPGAEGVLEVLANHAPLMVNLAPGFVEMKRGQETQRTYVGGGFAVIADSELQVLAEKAIPETALSGDALTTERDQAQHTLNDTDAGADARLHAERALSALSTY